MPHIEMKYSDNLNIKATDLFSEIEKAINEIDSSAGIYKSRAYPASSYLHTHALLSIKMLEKPHRDKLFMKSLSGKIEDILVAMLPIDCYYSIDLLFSNERYITSQVVR